MRATFWIEKKWYIETRVFPLRFLQQGRASMATDPENWVGGESETNSILLLLLLLLFLTLALYSKKNMRARGHKIRAHSAAWKKKKRGTHALCDTILSPRGAYVRWRKRNKTRKK